ncbi:hybrid sensor histidine kinase/response regulator transcription factor [Seonamhaeicola aphaedonensis]|uniref:histidine kinase n=1 Tax=Seonamhaeicola aphaedonensis TaxID=1461338 RepID=A0A3D9HDC7_9FLAO|nr:hybrid sensor histidine kinase/response regulator transcription factor [Seonamhaeicola aphaedonensis]RED47465.1 signal transduction histidine kinase [Seonamhaeicola aphaedonensis]
MALWFSCYYVQGQELVFEHYNEISGLSQNSIRSIIQDDEGFLWLGTFGGVNRFDGYNFRPFQSNINREDYLHSNDILQIVKDKKNNLWIATDFGLTKYHIPTHTFKTYHSNENNKYSLPDNKVRSVFIDNTDRLWVGTMSSGICYFDEEEEKFHRVDIQSVENIRGIYQTHDNKLWFTTFNNGVYSLEFDNAGRILKSNNFDLSPSKSSANMQSDAYFLFEDRHFNLYVGTKDGLYEYKNLENNFSLINFEGQGDYFRCYTVSDDGELWFGTSNGIITCRSIEALKNGKYKRHISDLTNTNSLVNNYILSLFFDASGILWVGTENGLDKLDPFENQFKTIKANFTSNGKTPIISSLSKTYTNKILLGTHSDGLYLMESDRFRRVLEAYKRISSIYTTNNKLFYIGLWNGKVLKYDMVSGATRSLDVGFSNSPVMSFYQINNRTLLIGSVGEGLVEFDLVNEKSTRINEELDALLDVNKIIPYQTDKVWLATEEGIFKYNFLTKETRHYKSLQDRVSLSNNKVKDIVIDANGKIWVGTRNGLNFYDPIKDIFLPQENPQELKNSWITDIAIDVNGCLWLNMNSNKIGKYLPDKSEFRAFHVNNGVRSNIINKRGFLQYDNNTIFIGGDKDIIHFSPLGIEENKYSPKPIITTFKINNEEVLPQVEVDGQIVMEKDLNYTENIALGYRNRNFSIEFSMPSYANERLNSYQYKLEGFDEKWNSTNTNSRTIQYTNLYPDDYVLKIKAENNNGYWSEVTNLKITIQSPFWLTYPFFIAVMLVVMAIIYFLRKQIKYRLQLKQELLLEKVKRERDEKLNNEKLRFFTNISHELRTPLTLILGPAKQLLHKENKIETDKNKLELIYHNANRLLRLVNQILDFRRAETGELKLKVTEVDVLQSTKLIFNSFIELANTKHINFNFNTEDESMVCWVDFDKLNKILFNLLSNAMKFTNNYGNVDLFVGIKGVKDKKLVIEVSDDGIGIPQESKEMIFTRFYQAKNSKENTTGTGIGLSLVKALVEIHKGTIAVDSETDTGSVFTVELPANKEAYTPDEILEQKPDDLQKNHAELISMESVLIPNTKDVKKSLNTDLKHEILVVEDNPELRNYIVENLSESYKVYEAENGQEGFEICKRVKPVLCVVDAMMPVMDGFDFVEAVKNDDNMSHTAIIMLTALAENENRIKAYKIGVDGYLVKPFDPALLKTRIENVIKIHFDLKQRFSGDAESDVMTLAHSQIDIDLISQIKEIIENNLSSPNLSPAFISKEMAMSSSKLYRRIKQLTDLSPNEFIRTIRLKKSAQLLKTKNYNVSEVSDLVGFNDPLYFSRVFKKQFGYSPSKVFK